MNAIPETMAAVLLTGHGDFDKLSYRTDVPVPRPEQGEVLIRVAAAGINNTDINTRVGWYSKDDVKEGNAGTTGDDSAGDDTITDKEDGGWSGMPFVFPRIQGGDCCGRIVAVGKGVDSARIGERVMVPNFLRSPVDYRPMECWVLGSECDGAFAQFMTAPAEESHAIDSGWTDAELASIPCAYSTAENLLTRAGLTSGERVLITGASGGVGSAAVQLARRRGAVILAVSGRSKAEQVRAIGADLVIPRDGDLIGAVGRDSVDVVIDLVAGPMWPDLLTVLKRGGRYAVAGALAGHMVELDVRTLYLKDLSFFGCTFQEDGVFENLIAYIEKNEIRPLVHQTYPLDEIVRAQKEFLKKEFFGKLVLIP